MAEDIFHNLSIPRRFTFSLSATSELFFSNTYLGTLGIKKNCRRDRLCEAKREKSGTEKGVECEMGVPLIEQIEPPQIWRRRGVAFVTAEERTSFLLPERSLYTRGPSRDVMLFSCRSASSHIWASFGK